MPRLHVAGCIATSLFFTVAFAADSKTLIQLRGGKGHVFPEEDVAKVREILFHDCFRL
jgi:hypothetical protein